MVPRCRDVRPRREIIQHVNVHRVIRASRVGLALAVAPLDIGNRLPHQPKSARFSFMIHVYISIWSFSTRSTAVIEMHGPHHSVQAYCEYFVLRLLLRVERIFIEGTPDGPRLV